MDERFYLPTTQYFVNNTEKKLHEVRSENNLVPYIK
jgi:hypothetical protein